MRSIKDIMRSWAVLDSNGVHIGGTDKESNHHYGDAYSKILEWKHHWQKNHPRLSTELMMEVGIADGSSLLAWSEIFPNARCVGLDIHVAEKVTNGRYNNIEFHLGDQRSKKDCERAAGGRLFDFIVEDATHVLENTLLTLYWLWPFVRPGGIYVVEEWSGVDRNRIESLFPFAEIVDTVGPSGGIESLVVLRKKI